MLLLRVMGGLSIEIEAADPSFLRRPRLQSLLVLFAGFGPDGVSRDALHALLWPESDTGAARGSLKQLLYQARELGRLPIVRGDGATARLDPDGVRVDAWTFADAVSRQNPTGVVAAYAGVFADGFVAPPELDELGRWVERRRAAMEEQYEGALSALCHEASIAGDLDGLIRYRRRLVAVDPLSSRAALGLMEALALAGDRPAALSAARAHRAVVRAELDSEPDPSLVRYELALRRGDTERVVERASLVAPIADVAPMRPSPRRPAVDAPRTRPLWLDEM